MDREVREGRKEGKAERERREGKKGNVNRKKLREVKSEEESSGRESEYGK